MLVRSITTFLITVAYALVSTHAINAQEIGAAKVYKTQFLDLHLKVRNILTRSVEVRSEQDVMNLRGEVLALTKLVHRTSEEAGETNPDGLKGGHEPDKVLLLVSSGCEEMSFVLGALDNFLKTRDRSFLGLARKGDELTSSIESLL